MHQTRNPHPKTTTIHLKKHKFCMSLIKRKSPFFKLNLYLLSRSWFNFLKDLSQKKKHAKRKYCLVLVNYCLQIYLN